MPTKKIAKKSVAKKSPVKKVINKALPKKNTVITKKLRTIEKEKK